MKRVLSFVMCLCMLVGLMPAAVLAAGENETRSGLYSSIGEDGSLSGDDYIEIFQNAEGIWGYFGLSYTPGVGTSLYYYLPDCKTFVVEGEGLSSNATEYANIYEIKIAPQCRGSVGGSFYYETATGNSNGGPIAFHDGSDMLYSFDSIDSTYYDFVQKPADGTKNLILAIDGADGKVHLDNSYQIGSTLGSITWTDEGFVWDSTNIEPSNGYIWATKGNEYYLMNARVNPAQGGGNEGGGNNNNGIGDIILGAHATQPSELYDVTNGIPSHDVEDAISQFTYNGETYYFGVGSEGIPFFSSGGSTGISMVPNQYIFSKYGIAFYVKEGDGYIRVQEAALAQELFAQFTELDLKIWAIEYSDPGIELTASETFPAIYNATIDDCFSNCVAMQIGLEHKGNYIITASGSYNGEVLSSYTYDTWDPRYEIIFEYDETSQLDYIAQVNAFLNNVTADASASVIVNMPEGIYNGYIEIPARLGNMDVSVYGSFNQNTGELFTTINGGIICSSSHGTAFNINFVGAGKDNAEWPTGSVNAGKENYAFMGSGDIRPRQCRISDFDIALYGEEKHKNSRGSIFFNNGTAIYFGNGESTGDPIFEYNTFISNDIAIDFAELPENMATSIFSFKECVFIDNDIDVYNRLDRRVYIPGCYFAETIDGIETTRACVFKTVGNQQGEGVGNLRKQVLFYPQAANKDFTEYIYDTNTGFYGGKNPIVSVNFTKTFPIPAGALDGVTLDVMKHDELLARIDFNTASSGSSSGARAFSTRSGSSSEATFDATVEVERSEDGSIITIKLNAFPGGKKPTVSVPCDETWTKAEVYDENGNEIKATITEGFVSFIAPSGGEYTIKKHVHSPAAPVHENIVDASCSAEGSYDEVIYCSVCTEELSREAKTIDKLDHTPAAAVRENEVAATYEKEGSYDEVIYCSVCTEEISREAKTVDKLTAPSVAPSIPSTPSTSTEKVENPDGSVTTTVTDNKTGTVTETTETKDGVTGTVVTDSEGNVTEISAEIPENVDTSSPVTIPVEVKAAEETEISIKTNSKKKLIVEIPVSDASAGTVAVLVDEDGNETVIQQSTLSENGITAPIPDGATIKVVDNSKDFEDVSDEAWYAEAIDFASAREIVNGMGDDSFQPKSTTNRAMIWTMLARLDGVDTSGGNTWYEIGMNWAVEKGISDGTNALAEVTREQIVTMFWRYMGEPESDGDLSDYTDGHETSDWAIKAKAWAVDAGLIQGMSDGTLNPGGNANRAQVAQMIMNLFNL